MKKKLYIFFTYGYYGVSGGLMYTAGKAKYLQEHGWQVFIFSHEPAEGKTMIPFLDQFHEQGGVFSFS